MRLRKRSHTLVKVAAIGLASLVAVTVATADTGGKAVHAGHDCTWRCGSHADAMLDAPLALAPPLRGVSLYRIPTAFHIIRRSDGTGGLREHEILEAMRELNRRGFPDTPFVFVPISVDYVDSDLYYDCPNSIVINTMRGENNNPNAMNVHIPNSMFDSTLGAQITGISSRLSDSNQGVAAIAVTFRNPYVDIVLAHEAGHFLGLWHTNETAFGLECVEGFNCGTAGDLVCDTPATPGLRLNVNVNWLGQYYGTASDPCGSLEPYSPDTDNMMESATFRWMLDTRFTPGQIDRMEAFLTSFRPEIIDQTGELTFIDCNENGIDDIDEIVSGQAVDLDRDWIPDACTQVIRDGDLLVTAMNSFIFTPIEGNALLFGPDGEPRGRADYSSSFMHTARIGPDGAIYMTAGINFSPPHVARVDRRVNLRDEPNGVFALPPSGAGTFVDLLFKSNTMLVLDNVLARIYRYNATTGQYISVFADLSGVGMTGPKYMEFGPDGTIYVVGNGALGNTVQRVDSTTGALLGSFITPGAGGLAGGQGLVFEGDHLYISNGGANNVLRYDALTGAFVDVFVTTGAGGLSNPHSLRFGPDGHLYVASRNTNSVKRYDGSSGAYIHDFVASGAEGLQQPTGLLFIKAPCVGDLTGAGDLPDGIVDADDFFALLQNWGPCPPSPAACPWDLTGNGSVPDGEVGTDDFFALLQNWGPCE